MQMNEEVIW